VIAETHAVFDLLAMQLRCKRLVMSQTLLCLSSTVRSHHRENVCVVAGKFCQGTGLDWPTGDCDPGWYCTGSSTQARPTADGGRCVRGQFCPAGSAAPQACTPGRYCGEDGLSEPEGNCSAGFYCAGGSKTSQPDGLDSTGELNSNRYHIW